MVWNSFAKLKRNYKLNVIINKIDESVKLYSCDWDGNLASCLQAVGIACLVVSPGSHFSQPGWVQFLLGLACVSFFSQEAGLLAPEVSGFAELARNKRSLAGTVQRHTWGEADAQPFSCLYSPHNTGCQKRPHACRGSPGRVESCKIWGDVIYRCIMINFLNIKQNKNSPTKNLILKNVMKMGFKVRRVVTSGERVMFGKGYEALLSSFLRAVYSEFVLFSSLCGTVSKRGRKGDDLILKYSQV